MFSSRLVRVARSTAALQLPRILATRPTVWEGAAQRSRAGTAPLSSSTSLRHPVNPQPAAQNPTDVRSTEVNSKCLTTHFADGTSSSYPFVWMRENCQCPKCFQKDAIARIFLIDDLDLDIQPKNVQVEEEGVTVQWPDGHISSFSGQWLHQRAFTPNARDIQRSWYMLPKEHWGPGFEVPKMKYSAVMHDDEALLEWLVDIEKFGVTIVYDAPVRVGAINDFIERLGFVKPTHYGKDYELKLRLTPNNLAYTGEKLGLHTDLPYVEYPPGTTWLHCIKQHKGEGGDNDLSDGFNAAEVLKARHPHHYHALVNTPIYFQDRGYEQYDFDLIKQERTISTDHQGIPCRIHVSSQSRHTFMDLDADGVMAFYSALKTYNDILYEHSIRLKTKPGDILILDNTRVLHGRTPFDPNSAGGDRHLHNAYIDLDNLRSKRRVLQREKLGIDR